MKRILPRSLILLLLSIMPLAAHSQTGGTITAASCNLTDVQSALNSVTSSTTLVVIPAGTCAWTGGITWAVPSGNTNLTIQGQTTINCTGTAGTSSYACTAADHTIIQDVYQSNNPLMVFNFNSSPSALFRVTGLTLAGGAVGSSSYSKYNGIIEGLSGSSQVRFDHNHCNFETYSPVPTSVCFKSFAAVTGVADHNVFDLAGTNSTYPFAISIYAAYGDTMGNGDGTYNNPTPWGASTPFFVESNVENGGVINDCDIAGTMVIRYNNINDASVAIQTHGTKTEGGPYRGCRSIEMYNNYITGPTGGGQQSAALGTKGSAALIYNNVMASGYYRFYEGGGDRQSGDAAETPPANGWGYCGTSINNNGVGSQWDGNEGGGGSSTASGYPCLDGLGRGQEIQSLNGANFPGRLNSTTGTVAWPHQYLEPQYLWNNSIGGNQYMLITDGSVNNRDYYYDCGSVNSSCSAGFTGTAGTGYGLLSARPSTCTAGGGGTYLASPTGSYGVGYFATDANGGQGELYVCTSTNTWTGVYKPYTYPHPLVSGSTSTTNLTPPPPSKLSGTVIQ